MKQEWVTAGVSDHQREIDRLLARASEVGQLVVVIFDLAIALTVACEGLADGEKC